MNQRAFTLSSMNPGTALRSAHVAGREFWEVLSRHPQAAPMKQIAKHRVLSATQIFQSESLAGYTARKLSYLTPNIADERRRSAQRGGVRSTGWLAK